MVEYRPIPKERLDEFEALWSYAYRQLDDHVAPDDTDRRIEPARVGEQRGVFDGDELVAICRHHFLRATVRDTTRPIGCLASVATPPEHRRKGYVRTLIESFLEEYRDQDVPLSALWAFDYPFYERYGWELANQYAVRECPAEALSSTTEHTDGEFVRLGPDEYEHIAGDTDDEGLSQFGGSVHVFEHALSMLLPDPDGGGIGFSFEPGTGRQLFDFVGACRAAGFQVDDEEGEASSGADGTDTDGGSPDGSAPDADDE